MTARPDRWMGSGGHRGPLGLSTGTKPETFWQAFMWCLLCLAAGIMMVMGLIVVASWSFPPTTEAAVHRASSWVAAAPSTQPR